MPIPESKRLEILQRFAQLAEDEIKLIEAQIRPLPRKPARVETPEEIAARYEGEPLVRCISLVGTMHSGGDGTHHADIWRALGYSGSMHLHEIYEIPESFFKQLKAEGAVTGNPEAIKEWENRQANFQRKQREWREKHSAEVARAQAATRELEVKRRMALAEAQAESEKKAKIRKQIEKELA